MAGGPANGQLAIVVPKHNSYTCPFDSRTPKQLRGARFGRTKECDPHFGFAIFAFRTRETNP